MPIFETEKSGFVERFLELSLFYGLSRKPCKSRSAPWSDIIEKEQSL